MIDFSGEAAQEALTLIQVNENRSSSTTPIQQTQSRQSCYPKLSPVNDSK